MIKEKTLNVFGFNNDNKHTNRSVESIIIESKADVVLIQEDIVTNDFAELNMVHGYQRIIQCKTSHKPMYSPVNSIFDLK